MANSINTNIAAYYAQANITAASTAASSSVARLSSGNRIVQASDDVSALASGTSLLTQVSALRTAQSNVSQGSSLLQVADGALAQIQNILQQMKSVALQAGSGSLTNTDRGFLNQQFQALSAQIDTLSKGTSFNGVALLDGSLSSAAQISEKTATANGSQIVIGLNTNGSAGNTITVNGVQLTAVANNATPGALEFRVGADQASTMGNLADALTSLSKSTAVNGSGQTYSSLLGQASYKAIGTALYITSVTGGALSNNFSVDTTNANSTLISGTKATISGGFGGTSIYMFRNTTTSGFTSASSSITSATTPTAAAPFVVGDTITATVGSNSAVNLYTLKTGDGLINIVNGINANTDKTKISATLSYDPAIQRYNIKLNSTVATGSIALNGGANFFNDSVSGVHLLNGAVSTQTLFTSDFAAQLSATTLIGSTTPSPFTTGSALNIVQSDGSYLNISGTLSLANAVTVTSTAAAVAAGITAADGANLTLANLRDMINLNANAKSAGITASISSGNLLLTFADATQAKSLGFVVTGANFVGTTDTYGSLSTVGLNSAKASVDLFATGFSSPAQTLSIATTATQAKPFVVGDSMTLVINGGSTLTLGTVVANQTLQDTAGIINASTDGIRNGIHAQVVQDADGKYNLRLFMNGGTTPTSATFSGGSGFFDTDLFTADGAFTSAAGNITAPSASASSPTPLTDGTYYNLFSDEQAAALNLADLEAAATRSTSQPFVANDRIYVAVGTSTTGIDITGQLTTNTGDTLSELATIITTNANAIAAGITASVTDDGKNIRIRYDGTAGAGAASSTNPILKFAIATAGTYTFATATALQPAETDYPGSVPTAGLNNSYNYVDLFTNYVAANQSLVNTSPTGQEVWDTTSKFSVTVGGQALVDSAAIFTAGMTAAEVVAALNADNTLAANNIHVGLVYDGSGNVNIRVYAADETGLGAQNITVSDSVGDAIFTGNALLAASTTNYYNNLLQGNTNGVAATTLGHVTAATQLAVFGGVNGADNGVGVGSASVNGTVGDNILTGLSQTHAKYTIGFPDTESTALTTSTAFNSDGSVYLTVGGHKFAFTTTAAASKAPDEITIGASLQETLDNAVSTINAYGKTFAQGEEAYVLSQINVSRSNNSLVFEGKAFTNPLKTTKAVIDAISLSAFGNSTTTTGSSTLANAATAFGLDVTGVSNADFVGKISGFEATYSNTVNTVDLALQVGKYTYRATGVTTVPSSNLTVRLVSDVETDGTNGGYFDVQLAAGNGQTVNSQTGADAIAARLDAAFSPLSFDQKRILSNYNGTQTIVANNTVIGTLVGSSVSAQLGTYVGVKLTGLTVTAPQTVGGDAKIGINIGDESFVSANGLGGKLGANQTYRLVSTSNSNHYIDFTTGRTAIDISTAANAKAVANALSEAFGASADSGALSFQVGSASSDTLSVSIGSAQTNDIFNGSVLDVSTQAGAQSANTVLTAAINTITSLRANVGALESRFNFAAAAIQSGVQNQDAARGQLLDTDIATESTAFATQQVKLQAGISVLAQANQQLQALLKLIG